MKHITRLSILATLLLLVACSTNGSSPSAKERGLLSTKMVNLSSGVDTYFHLLPGAPTGSDASILEAATRHDKALLAPEFQNYILRTQYQNPFAVILLCSKDGKQAIIEDAGCSARLDRQVTEDAPCEFTLHITQGCRVQGADPRQ